MQRRGVAAAWLAWALAFVALGLLFLMDARGWRNAQILDGGGWVGVDLHYRLERWIWLIAFVIGAVCVLVTVMVARTHVRTRLAAVSAVSLVALVVASGLALAAVQSTPGQFLPPTDSGPLTGSTPDQVATVAGLWAFGAAAVVLVGLVICRRILRDGQHA